VTRHLEVFITLAQNLDLARQPKFQRGSNLLPKINEKEIVIRPTQLNLHPGCAFLGPSRPLHAGRAEAATEMAFFVFGLRNDVK